MVYIGYLNKDNKFKPEKKYFFSDEAAAAWGLENLENYNVDMLRLERDYEVIDSEVKKIEKRALEVAKECTALGSFFAVVDFTLFHFPANSDNTICREGFNEVDLAELDFNDRLEIEKVLDLKNVVMYDLPFHKSDIENTKQIIKSPDKSSGMDSVMDSSDIEGLIF